MNRNYTKNVIIVILAAVMAFVTCGCSLFGDTDDGKDKITPAVYISQTEITLAEGDTVQLAAVSNDGADVTWVSLDPETATVDETGLLTAVQRGETMILAMSSTEATAFCTIKVTAPPQSGSTEPPQTETPDPEVLVLAMSSIGLTVGSNVTLTATSSTGANITWASSNPTVATVSNSGRVVGLAVGTATISADTGTAKATCNVTVTAAIPDGAEKPGYTLVWNDEFDGSTLDRTKWNYQTGTRDFYHDFDSGVYFWGNDEAQYYTQDAVSVSNGSLVITATQQPMDDGRTYKSGRILTRDLASWTYGFFEAKIKTPTGSGMWPAFWMLPQPSSYANLSNKYGGWPYSGEIDIMEAKGRLLNKVDTTLHYGPIEAGGWTSKYNTSEYTMSSNTDQWHTYAVEWTAQYIKWFVDGTAVMTIGCDTWYTLSSASAGAASPFDQPFYILLNLAVGGRYDNYNMPADNFTSASMYVDYVRVYKKNV